MDIASVLSAVVRRWYVAVLVLLLTGAGAYQLWASALPSYTTSTTVAVLPSPQLIQVRADANAGESSLANPFGVTATGVLASLLTDTINSGALDLPPEAAGSRVVVELDPQRASSYFTLVAVGRSEESTDAALQSAVTQAPALISAIQTTAGAPPDQLYTAIETRTAGPMSVAYPNRQRSALGVVLAGLLAAALLSVLVDSALTHRSRRRAGRKPERKNRENQDTGPAGGGGTARPSRISLNQSAPSVLPARATGGGGRPS